MRNNKITIIFLLLCVVATTSSCKKWLEVQPKTQLPADDLFTAESGFRDALAGVYVQMKSGSAYGNALMFGTIERLVSSWDVTSNTTESFLGLHRYEETGVQTAMDNIYTQEYKIIASVNKILAEIDAKKSVITSEGGYEMIKAECLAIRALCHFDLLRIFGPVPSSASGDPVLPYVKVIGTTPSTHLSFAGFKAELQKDLADAENLLKEVDPFIVYSQRDLTYPGNPSYTTFAPDNDFYGFRYLRMNYYAVKGLQARAHLWFGENEAAYAAAKVVIDAKNPDGNLKFRLGTSSDVTAADFNLSIEHIFGLYDFQLTDKFNNNFNNGTLKKGTSATTINSQLYGNTGTDIREVNYWTVVTLANASKCNIIKKYSGANLQIPMLRSSEMYLIAAETAPAAERQAYWDAFKSSRGISSGTLPTEEVALQLEIVKEYRREFYAEGQAFFAYKRVNAPKANVLFAPSAANINYVVPVPLSETIK